MKKLVCLTLCIAYAISALHAEEGMLQPFGADSRIVKRLYDMGLTIPYDSLFNTEKPSVKDAVVVFGGGCTGVIVSSSGLVFTNHHCGFGAIQSLSSAKNDYLKDGFGAKERNAELPVEDLTIQVLERSEDVTNRLLAGLADNIGEKKRNEAIDSISKVIKTEAETDKFTEARVVGFYGGNNYRLLVYKVFRDVRLVFAPPASLGKFGGETDNWMWPRHTADFSVFRIYVDAKGKPAKYSKENVPYSPRYVAQISTAGYQPGDLTMTVGNPGNTDRYLTSFGIEEVMNTENKPRIAVRHIKQQVWRSYMDKDQTIRIKYDTKFARSANYYKNSIGMNTAIVNNGLLQEKRAAEELFTRRLKANADLNKRYASLLDSLQLLYKSRETVRRNQTYLREAFRGSSDWLRIAGELNTGNMKNDSSIEAEIKGRFRKIYINSDPNVEREVLEAMIKIYADSVPEIYQPQFISNLKQKNSDDAWQKFVGKLVKKSAIADSSLFFARLRIKQFSTLAADPMVKINKEINEVQEKMQKSISDISLKINRMKRNFIEASLTLFPDSLFAPDANFTMRLSYGSIQPYSPRNGISYHYYTTSDGLTEKNRTGNPDYFLKKETIDHLKTRDFGQYADARGELRTCFLTTNDITGGNSGSPVFNKTGKLIGLAFDGNWESLSGDLKYDLKLQRCIGVDVRYMLYIMDKMYQMQRVINELQITQKP